MRRYDELKTTNQEEGGRPDDFAVESPTFDQKVIVFCGMKRDGTFGLIVSRNESMTGPRYHGLFSHTVLPKLGEWNGGNLDNIWWQKEGAPCHVTHPNMRYPQWFRLVPLTRFGPILREKKFRRKELFLIRATAEEKNCSESQIT